MNRDELTELVETHLSQMTIDEVSNGENDKLVDALWPVLAQVWADGWDKGGHPCPNPYGEVPHDR